MVVAFFTFLSHILLAITVITVVGTVLGLRFARRATEPQGVQVDQPTEHERRLARVNLEEYISRGLDSCVEGLLLTRSHHLPAEMCTAAWHWLDARRHGHAATKA
jgi:hypothetical protein